ncbi:GNAT family N-acetyltransferase [Streptococcus dentiloxodontae]
MSKITLEKIEMEDVNKLRDIAIQTFTETFAHDNTPEQLQAFFDQAYTIEVLSAELSHPESLYRFIKVDGQIAGYLKVNWGAAQTEHELADAFEIQRIYVLQKFQGLGLGKQMFEFALEIAEQKGFTWAWLGVWEHNFKAQAFYKKYGFEKFAEHAFPVSDDKVDVDWLLRKRLK